MWIKVKKWIKLSSFSTSDGFIVTSSKLYENRSDSFRFKNEIYYNLRKDKIEIA